MPAIAVDSHSIVWYLSADPRLSPKAADALDSATEAGELIHVPSICLVELTYLVEKGRLPAAARSRLIEALDDPATPCLLAPLDRLVADALESVSRSEVPDLPDRIVTATPGCLPHGEPPVTSYQPLSSPPAQPLPFPLSRRRCSSLLFSTRMPVAFHSACVASFSQISKNPQRHSQHTPLAPPVAERFRPSRDRSPTTRPPLGNRANATGSGP
jgi:PIN domain nuclease of toxin-antitoxin system